MYKGTKVAAADCTMPSHQLLSYCRSRCHEGLGAGATSEQVPGYGAELVFCWLMSLKYPGATSLLAMWIGVDLYVAQKLSFEEASRKVSDSGPGVERRRACKGTSHEARYY